MISNQEFKKVQVSGNSSLSLNLTRQLKELGLKKGDQVYTAVEFMKDGKKRIIIEKGYEEGKK